MNKNDDMRVSFLKSKIRSLRSVLTPPKLMAVDEWADEYRVLAREASSTGGKYKVSTVEVARGPMQAASERGVKKISIMCATQLMKTNVLENVIGHFVHLDPCPILILQPKDDTVESFSKEKLVPMILKTPVLLNSFGGMSAFQGRSSENTIKYKRFRGGYLSLQSAGSPANLAMRSIRIVLADEIDKYEDSREGDSLVLAEERMKTFSHNSLMIQVCSPTVKGSSRIERQYNLSDKRKGYVACPHCNHEEYLKWSNVKWNKDESGKGIPSSAHYICEECGVLWSERERLRLLTKKGSIKWRQTKKFTCCEKAQDPQETRLWDDHGHALCEECGKEGISNKHAGFHASFLYSPWSPLSEEVENFLERKESKPSLRAFVNTRLAETFEDDTSLESVEMDPSKLSERVEPPFDYVPDEVQVITAGVDVQGDRLEMEIVGWGAGDESWSLGYHVIEEDPSVDECWRKLDDMLLEPFYKKDGSRISIRSACVDSGGHSTQQVYAFCRPRKNRLIFPIKGGGEQGGTRMPIWNNAKVVAEGKPYIVGTNTAKDNIESMMKVMTPGPGYMHIPAGRADSWFKMIASEKRVIFHLNGQRKSRWEPTYKGARNEALDCRVYALAALEALRKFKIIKSRTLTPVGTAMNTENQIRQPINPQPQVVNDVMVTPKIRPQQGGPRPRRGGGFGSTGWGGRGGF